MLDIEIVYFTNSL